MLVFRQDWDTLGHGLTVVVAVLLGGKSRVKRCVASQGGWRTVETINPALR